MPMALRMNSMILGDLYFEYLPDALDILHEYISDEMGSYQDMAVLPDLSDRIGDDLMMNSLSSADCPSHSWEYLLLRSA